ncbi:MAG: pyridoxal phosphate-dependent aminotransferase, partial [Steroidobacteraceae bacterium]
MKRALEAARHPLGEGRGGMLRLDFNENTAGCSPRVCRALARLTPEEIATYPDAVAAHKRIARFYRVSPDELLLSNGADEALRLVFDAAVKPGDTILIAEPTFEMYRFYARLAHARVQAPRYDAEMKFPRSEYLRALRLKPKLALLANPNNPTGTLLDEKALSRIIRAARGTTLVLDEAYFEFSGVTALGWIRRHTNLVVIRTFSKAMGMAGLRLGCVLANRKFISRVREAKPPFSVNAAALHAAEAALGDRGTVRRYVAEVQNAKRMFEA